MAVRVVADRFVRGGVAPLDLLPEYSSHISSPLEFLDGRLLPREYLEGALDVIGEIVVHRWPGALEVKAAIHRSNGVREAEWLLKALAECITPIHTRGYRPKPGLDLTKLNNILSNHPILAFTPAKVYILGIEEEQDKTRLKLGIRVT